MPEYLIVEGDIGLEGIKYYSIAVKGDNFQLHSLQSLLHPSVLAASAKTLENIKRRLLANS
jgi:hypothetical protein